MKVTGVVEKPWVAFMMEGCNIHGVKDMAAYLCWGGILHEGTNGVMTYTGGNTRCVWLYENMRFRDVLKLVEHAMGIVLKEAKVWYTTKFDRRMFLPFENDGDIRSMMRGNDRHAYLYVTASQVHVDPARERSEPGQYDGVVQQQALQCAPNVDALVQSVGSRGCA